MIAASGWEGTRRRRRPLYDPCCGSGTIAIEAAQIACNIAPGLLRRFAFEKLLPFQAAACAARCRGCRARRAARVHAPAVPIFGSDVALRMVDFAQRNAERAGVGARDRVPRRRCAAAHAAGADAAGHADAEPAVWRAHRGRGVAGKRGARAQGRGPRHGGDFFGRLAAHWKKNYAGWTAWVLTPDLKLPARCG